MNSLLRLLIMPLSLVLTAFSACSQPVKPAKAEKLKKLYPYQIALPESYAQHPDSIYPVLIYLHGGSHRGTNPEVLKEWGPPMRVARGDKFPFILVFPQCPSDRLWISDNWFEPLMKDLKSRYRVDTAGIYVTGISMGGFGTWNVAMDFPRQIKGIAPLCGSCRDSINICKIKNIPVWAFHGVNDGLVRVIHTDRLVKRLQNCGGNVKYSRLEKRHHGIWNLYETDEIYNWFSSLYADRKKRLKPAN